MRILLPIFLLLSIVNIFIYINRNDGYEYVKQSSYEQLYPNISKGISKLSVEKEGEVLIDLKGFDKTQWSILCNDSVIKQSQSLPLKFSLKEKLNRYILRPGDSLFQPLIIDIDYSPASIYKAAGNSTATNYEIRYCNYAFVSADSNSVTKRKAGYLNANAEELKQVKSILVDSLHLKESDSTNVKIKIIGNYIYQSIQKSIGTPADSLAKHSVYEQFCFAKNKQAKIWCGNIADIFHLFATQAGIVCRQVGLTGTKEDLTTGLHSTNECYIPETGTWAYVDITQDILLLQDSDGHYLNTVDLFQLKKLNQAGNLNILTSTDSGIITTLNNNADKKYVWKENEILFPYAYDASKLYSWQNKIKRYLSENPWLEIYSEKTIYDNHKFYRKIYLFYSWVIVGLLTLLTFLFRRKQ